MKLTITSKELKAMIFKEFGHDIDVDIEIEGYTRVRTTDMKPIPLLHDTLGFPGEDDPNYARNLPEFPRRTTTVDKDGFVTDIKDEVLAQKSKAEIKNKWRSNLNNHPDYTDYENTVLDFATSPEHKRQVPFFGAGTIACCKTRYQKMIDKLGISDSVKFSRLNSLPYLVKIEGNVNMAEELKKGINE